MPLSHNVTLPRGVEPKWPDRCIVCCSAAPGGSVRVCTASIGLSTLLTGQFGRLYWARVPACRRCGRRLHAVRALRLMISCVMAFLGVSVALWVLKTYDGSFRRPLGVGITLVALTPFFLWETFLPQVFDMTALAEKVDFEFREPAYAAEFESLNREFVQ